MKFGLDLDGGFPCGLRKRVLEYNWGTLSYSNDQIIPMEHPFGGRWFDDFAVRPAMFAVGCS